MCWRHLQLVGCELEIFLPVCFESSISTGTLFIRTYGKNWSFSVLKSKSKNTYNCRLQNVLRNKHQSIPDHPPKLKGNWPKNSMVFILCLKLHFSLLTVAFGFQKKMLHYADMWVNSVGNTFHIQINIERSSITLLKLFRNPAFSVPPPLPRKLHSQLHNSNMKLEVSSVHAHYH